MSYVRNGKILGIVGPEQAAAGLGAYTGFNTDAIGKEIIAHNGGTNSSDLKAYAKTAGAAAGAAFCTAYGGAAVAPACATVAAALLDVFVGHIGAPATAGNAWTIVDTWNEVVLPAVEAAAVGALKIRAYLTMRDAAIDEIANGDNKLRGWADGRLTELGCPPAPVLPEWAPRKDLWEAYKAVSIWSEHPVGVSPANPGFMQQKFQGKNLGTGNPGDYWGYESHSPAYIAQHTNLTLPEVMMLLSGYACGPMAPGDAPINFGIVGAWEWIATGNKWAQKVQLPISVWNESMPPNQFVPHLVIQKTPYSGQVVGWPYQYTNGLSPAQLGQQLLFKLQDASAAIKKETKTNVIIAAAVQIARIKKAEEEKKRRRRTAALVLGAAAVAGVGYVGWKRKMR